MADEALRVVGEYISAFNDSTSLNLPLGKIYISDGFSVHIQKRHPECLKYIRQISDIIAAPDYIGHNLNEPESIELIKTFDLNVQIAIKLDTKQGYLYVASLYDIKESKIERRLASGRLKRF